MENHQINTTGSSSSSSEATERFRRIAEAYQVLSDPEQRQEYDLYLDQQRRQQQQHQRRSYQYTDDDDDQGSAADRGRFFSWKNFMEMDPLKVFEEFFFAQDDDDDEDMDGWFGAGGRRAYRTAADPFADTEHEEESWYMHPQYGQVLRVSRSEQDERGYRIVYQDFVEDWDPYRRTWSWYPLTPEPVVFVPSATLQGRLEPPAVLRQGPFVAGLYDCQLQVRRGSSIVWRAPGQDDFGDPFAETFPRQCALSLVGSRLVLHVNGRVTWKTPMAPEEATWIQSRHRRGRPQHFEARLDPDGNLAIYRTDLRSQKNPTQFLDQLQSWIWKDPRCCYSTGPVGCHRLGRLLVRILTLDRRLGDILRRLSRLFDRFLDWLEGEGDEDYF